MADYDFSSGVTVPDPPLTTNTYASIATANDYFDEVLGGTNWAAASTANQNKALVAATKAIDLLRYEGEATDAAVALGNQFPRGTDLVVPDAVVWACIEEADALLGEYTVEEKFDDLRITSERMSGVSITHDSAQQPEHIRSGLLSRKAWRYLRPYIADNLSMRVSRVS